MLDLEIMLNRIVDMAGRIERQDNELRQAYEKIDSLTRQINMMPQKIENINMDVMNNMLIDAKHGRKIEAIKAFRSTFNTGLKEAKDMIELIYSQMVKPVE